MTGSYNLVLSNKSLRYELTIDRQVTIIKGDSATGKTTLVRYFTEAADPDNKAMHCNMADKLEVITASRIEQFKALESIEHGKIFIADENKYIVRTKEFAEIVNNSDNYYILITRSSDVKWLTFSVDSVFELRTKNIGGDTVTKLYSKYLNNNISIKPDLVITEDSNSGYEMFKSVMNCDIVSAKGKDNVYNTITENIGKYSSIYVIVDGSAFGGCIGRIVELMCKYNNIYIFAPESFEYLLLRAKTFSRFLTTELDEPYNYCDTKQFISWERYFTWLLKELSNSKYKVGYSKSKLDDFFMSDYYKEHIKNMLTDIDFS